MIEVVNLQKSAKPRTDSARERPHVTACWIATGILGAIEGIFGRNLYLRDWVSYLNVSQAFSRHDWKSAFDPMWTPGYPALVALVRGFAPATPIGEWHAINALNWVIFLVAFASLRYLVRQVGDSVGGPTAAGLKSPILIWTVWLLFCSFELCIDRVSRVSPDLLISSLLILASAQLLRVMRERSVRDAVILGLILGLGCWMKGVFVAYSGIVLASLVLARFLPRRLPVKFAALASASFLVLLIPYAWSLSWSYGHFTLGTSGELNYAFHVNRLPHWSNWQGGPAEFGAPQHPTTKLLPDLPVFAFAEPFRTTYPPFNNLSYYYLGFKHHFSPLNQARALAWNLYFLLQIVRGHPIVISALALIACALVLRDMRKRLLALVETLWPVLLVALGGIGTYLFVHIEDRYIPGMLLMLSLLPVIAIAEANGKPRRIFLIVVCAAYGLGGLAELKSHLGPDVPAMIHHRDFRSDEQWKLASFLSSSGVNAGDAVAVAGQNDLCNCSWAYVARVRVVAEFGGLPWSLAPWDRPLHGRYWQEEADKDWKTVFWQLSPEDRGRVMQAFQSAGVRLVVALPGARPASSDWIAAGDSGAWVYSFDPQLTAQLRSRAAEVHAPGL